MINENYNIQSKKACEKYPLTMKQATIYLWFGCKSLTQMMILYIIGRDIILEIESGKLLIMHMLDFLRVI